MVNKEKVFRKHLIDLIRWRHPDLKHITKLVDGEIFVIINNALENSDCTTCDEDEEVERTLGIYPPKIWTCKVCNKVTTDKNKTNHLRSYKHKNKVKTKENDSL